MGVSIEDTPDGQYGACADARHALHELMMNELYNQRILQLAAEAPHLAG